MLSKQHSGKTKRCRWFRCSRIKMPKIRREKPRPSQSLPSRNDIRRNRPTIENRALKSDGSTLDQVKSVRWFPCFEYHLVLCETRWHSRLCQNSDVIHRNSLQERVSSDALLEIVRTHLGVFFMASLNFTRAAWRRRIITSL